MKKSLKSGKGFTLIELLAVIVILGILLMTAIPAVTRNIAKSRRNTFWQNAKSYIKAVATPFLAGEYVVTSATGTVCTAPAPGQSIGIYLTDVELEQGSTQKSSFGAAYKANSDNCAPMIIVKNEGKAAASGKEQKDTLVWYFIGVDQSGNGIATMTKEADLGLAAVTTGITTCTKPSVTKMCQPA